MPRVLRWARALPSLRTLLLHRRLATVFDQAVALSSAVTCRNPEPLQPSQGAGSFSFIWLGSQNKAIEGGQSTEGIDKLACRPCGGLTIMLPKGLPRPLTSTRPRQTFWQLIVSRHTVCRLAP